jgi:hypothetical protein
MNEMHNEKKALICGAAPSSFSPAFENFIECVKKGISSKGYTVHGLFCEEAEIFDAASSYLRQKDVQARKKPD